MAVTSEPEDACFTAFKAAFTADTGLAVNALNDSSQTLGVYNSNAFLIGGFFRKGDPLEGGSPTVARIVWEATGITELDTQSFARTEGLVRLHHFTERNTPDGFGNQASPPQGSQQAVVARSRKVFHRAALTATNGWNFSTMVRKRGFQGPSSATEQHYIVEYQIVMSAGTGGGF